MKTDSEVRDQLVKMLGEISRAQGYKTDFIPEKIYKWWDANIANSDKDATFPKTFVILDQGAIGQGIGGDNTDYLSFYIVHVVKRIAKTDKPQEMLEDILADYKRFFKLNRSLGGFVQTADLVEFATDGGSLDPEGTLAIRVKTERTDYGNP